MFVMTTTRESGFSLIEVLLAAGLLVTALVALAQLFIEATRANVGARHTTYATVLADRKLEELRALTWSVDPQGVPVSDTSTNTAVSPETAVGGTGLGASPPDVLLVNTPGYVDHVDRMGRKTGAGAAVAPTDAVYTRRWSITPLPGDPDNSLVIQVSVMRAHRAAATGGVGVRGPEEARVITVRTRKAP